MPFFYPQPVYVYLLQFVQKHLNIPSEVLSFLFASSYFQSLHSRDSCRVADAYLLSSLDLPLSIHEIGTICMARNHLESGVGFTDMNCKRRTKVDAHYEISKDASNWHRDLDLVVDIPGPDRVQHLSIVPQILKTSISNSSKMRIGVEILFPKVHHLKFVEYNALRRAIL